MWASDSDPRLGGQEFAYETSPPPPPDWVHDGVCYHVMVDRFARPGESLPPPGDSTALYGGTLDGIREKLDHIAELSCNVLWLSPVHRSPSHHGYDHEDFLEVEPRYGGDAALVRLVNAAHGQGMRVLLDFVPNHTGRGHHLFRDAIAKDGDAADYYRFWQWPHYYRSFFDVISLPELDTGNSDVRRHLIRAAQHWLIAYGIDGVRCDHVAGVDPAFCVPGAELATHMALELCGGEPSHLIVVGSQATPARIIDFPFKFAASLALGNVRSLHHF